MRVGKSTIYFLTILLLASMVLGSGCTDNGSGDGRAVKAGDTVQVDYVGKFENGTVFDTSIEEEAQEAGIYNAQREYVPPLNLTAGSGQVIEGFDEGLIGMKEGEEKTLTIPPEKAYGGEYNESWVQAVPLEELNMSEKPEVGQVYSSIYGGQFKVIAVNETHVTFDPNHELAGETLVFDVKLVSIE